MGILNLNQNSSEWLQWRVMGIGGSDAPILYNGEHFKKTPLGLYRKKLEETSLSPDDWKKREHPDSSAMARGRKLEPQIRAQWEKWTGLTAETVCMVHDVHPWIKGSLDGWNPEHKLVLEIKAPNRLDHQAALDGDIPEKYKPQCDHLLMCSGGAELHYVSYSNYFPEAEQFAIVEWQPDKNRIDQLFKLESYFWKALQDRDETVMEDFEVYRKFVLQEKKAKRSL